MSNVCEITGRHPSVGNSRSHSNIATKRRYLPNLVVTKVIDPKTGKWKRMKVSAAALRTMCKSVK